MARSNFSAGASPTDLRSYWLDGERMAECYGCQAKVQINAETINLPGEFMEHQKPTGGKGTGSLSLYKVDSGMILRMKSVQDGVIPRRAPSCLSWPTRTVWAMSALLLWGDVLRPDPGGLADGHGGQDHRALYLYPV